MQNATDGKKMEVSDLLDGKASLGLLKFLQKFIQKVTLLNI